MQYHDINTDEQLRQYCRGLVSAKTIAFDTEFVSEHTYRPVLCLIQVAADGDLAVIDAIAIPDVKPFWEAVAAPGHETIVHAGRGEVEFCLQAVGRLPERLIDVQLAAGLVGAEYPAGLGTLISKFLGRTPPKHETRTDWRRRPLSKRQVEYALNDARYLEELYETIRARLDELGRRAWLEEEMESWQKALQRSLSQERWRRFSGGASLDARGLAIARELFHWRDREAHRRDQPVRRILRDDLIVELARRGTADPKRIQAVRGLERGDLQRHVKEIAAAIQRGLDVPEVECPPRASREYVPELSVLGQFLFAALGSICRQAQLAPNLVGGPNDIREWIAYRTHKAATGRRADNAVTGDPADKPASGGDADRASTGDPADKAKTGGRAHHHADHSPQLARGWRAEFVGRLFEDLLTGNLAIRVANPHSEHPLAFEEST